MRMASMLQRAPDLIVISVTGILVLRASLWLVSSEAAAHFLVATLFPLWVVLELALLTGVVVCALWLVGRRTMRLFGLPAGRQTVLPLILVGLATVVLEAALWLYGSGAV